jgi:hypothetical protein
MTTLLPLPNTKTGKDRASANISATIKVSSSVISANQCAAPPTPKVVSGASGMSS